MKKFLLLFISLFSLVIFGCVRLSASNDIFLNGNYIYNGTPFDVSDEGLRVELSFTSNSIPFSFLYISVAPINIISLYYHNSSGSNIEVYRDYIWFDYSYQVITFNDFNISQTPSSTQIWFYKYFTKQPIGTLRNDFFTFFEEVELYNPLSLDFRFSLYGDSSIYYQGIVINSNGIFYNLNGSLVEAWVESTSKWQLSNIMHLRNASFDSSSLALLSQYGYFSSQPVFEYNARDLFFAIADTPFIFLSNLFGFELFGINLWIALTSILSLCFVIFLLKRFL